LLADGKVLIAGEQDNSGNALASAELYDPSSGSFSLAGSMNVARVFHTAVPLADGTTLIAGGVNSGGFLASAEIYDPASGLFALTGSLNVARRDAISELLGNGEALIAGRSDFSNLSSAELFDPTAGAFAATGDMTMARDSATAVGLEAICKHQEHLLGTTSTSKEMQVPSSNSASAIK
jgi:hypothetical protein